MRTLTFKPGQVIDTGEYPPRLVFVGFWNGEGTALLHDNPDEDFDGLLREAMHRFKVQRARNKRLERHRGIG